MKINEITPVVCLVLLEKYNSLNKHCKKYDQSIYNIGINYDLRSWFSTTDRVLDMILNRIERKNQLCNLKVILNDAVSRLSIKDQCVAKSIMKLYLTHEEFSLIFNVKKRTSYRRKEMVCVNLCEILNKKRYKEDVLRIVNNSDFLLDAIEYGSVIYEIHHRPRKFIKELENEKICN